MNLLMASKKILRSPLRYPGGKQKDIPFLSRVIHRVKEVENIKDFREPFLGGGCVLLYALSHNLADSYWGNDANPLLMDFWHQVQDDVELLCTKVEEIREPYDGPRRKSTEWVKFRRNFLKKLDNLPNDLIHRAARFFILNRSSASGATESGGLTPLAYCERFTDSSIERLRSLSNQLSNVKLTCDDYSKSLRETGENVFIFLDPPYLSAKQSKLYGKRGNLHSGFNHGHLAAELKSCPHLWLMTIDNSEEIRDLYSWAEIYPWEKIYGMTNFEGRRSREGQELLVANFKLYTSIEGDKNRLPVFRQSESIDPKRLVPHLLNKEIYGDNDNIYDLLESIQRNGFFETEPILVWSNKRRLHIISGTRRCRAAIEAGLQKVPIIYLPKDLDPLDVEYRIVDENRHRVKDGLQISREFEHRKRIELERKQKLKLQKNTLQETALIEEASNLAANTLGYSAEILEGSIKSRKHAESLKNQGLDDQALEIFKLIEDKKFEKAYQLSCECINSLKNIPQRLKQKSLFNSQQEAKCYLSGQVDDDFQRLKEIYGDNHAYLESLRQHLDNYLK